MGNMREKAKVLQPTVINGNGNDSEEYFFFFSSLQQQLFPLLWKQNLMIVELLSCVVRTETQINFPITWPITPEILPEILLKIRNFYISCI